MKIAVFLAAFFGGALVAGCDGESVGADPKTDSVTVRAATPTPTPKPSGLVFEKRRIKVGQREVVVEIADTDARRAQGLMYRDSLPANAGMLFLFDFEHILRFWMKNTRIPLSIAYIDSKHKIVDIQDMMPASEMELAPKVYPSARPAKFALEMNLGWFRKNRVKVGDSIEF